MWYRERGLDRRWEVYDPQGRLVRKCGRRASRRMVTKMNRKEWERIGEKRRHVIQRKASRDLFGHNELLVEIPPLKPEELEAAKAMYEKLKKLAQAKMT